MERRDLAACNARSAGGFRRPTPSPSWTMKLPCVVDTRASPHEQPLRPARSINAPAEGGIPSGTRSRAGSGFWKIQPALGTSSGCVRLRNASDSRAVARSSSGLAGGDVEDRRQRHFPAALQAARVVAEAHLVDREIAHVAVRHQHTDFADQIADVAAAKMRVAVDGSADGAGRTGPGFDAGQAAADGPAHETIDRQPRRRAHAVFVDLRDLAIARRGRRSRERRCPTPAHSSRRRARSAAARLARAIRAATISCSVRMRFHQIFGGTADVERRVAGERGVHAHAGRTEGRSQGVEHAVRPGTCALNARAP